MTPTTSAHTERAFAYADEWASQHVYAAFAGDVAAVQDLASALSNEKRGGVAVLMWRAKVPRPAFQAFLESVWDHDHWSVIQAAGTRARLASLFRYARYDLADVHKQRLHVWRGVSGQTTAVAARGYSWSMDRDVACWFAMRYATSGRKPVLLRARISKLDIAHFSNVRGEREVVLLHQPVAIVDGDLSDWSAAAHRHQSSIPMRARQPEL